MWGCDMESDLVSGQKRSRSNDPEKGRRGNDVNGLESFQVEQLFISGDQIRGLRFYGSGKDHQIVKVLNGGRDVCGSRD